MGRIALGLRSGTWARSVAAQLVLAVLFGMLVFAMAYVALTALLDRPAAVAEGTRGVPLPLSPAADSLGPRLAAGTVAVAAPAQGAQGLLTEVQPGDRLDVIALLPATATTPALSAVLVRGAVVLARPPDTSGSPVLLQVTPEESIVLAHAVQGGTPITYALWPAGGPPPPVPPIDPSALRPRSSTE